mmetsp:Transcript_7894/g.16425  ORF Transcript_7894/g.16425 Transcript_7894/m.16425 type:complete len:213 (+) Transcript_7894:495-1133(+)
MGRFRNSALLCTSSPSCPPRTQTPVPKEAADAAPLRRNIGGMGSQVMSHGSKWLTRSRVSSSSPHPPITYMCPALAAAAHHFRGVGNGTHTSHTPLLGSRRSTSASVWPSSSSPPTTYNIGGSVAAKSEATEAAPWARVREDAARARVLRLPRSSARLRMCSWVATSPRPRSQVQGCCARTLANRSRCCRAKKVSVRTVPASSRHSLRARVS